MPGSSARGFYRRNATGRSGKGKLLDKKPISAAFPTRATFAAAMSLVRHVTVAARGAAKGWVRGVGARARSAHPDGARPSLSAVILPGRRAQSALRVGGVRGQYERGGGARDRRPHRRASPAAVGRGFPRHPSAAAPRRCQCRAGPGTACSTGEGGRRETALGGERAAPRRRSTRSPPPLPGPWPGRDRRRACRLPAASLQPGGWSGRFPSGSCTPGPRGSGPGGGTCLPRRPASPEAPAPHR